MAVTAVLQRMTGLDRTIVLILLLVIGALFLLLGNSPPGNRVVVERQGEIIFTAPLDEDRSVALTGPLGETLMEIRDHRVWITASPCPHKDCMRMGRISRGGELLACVPNHLLIRIEGAAGNDAGPDLISR